MSVAISFHKQTVGRTFTVAITVLGLGALMQFSAIGWLFFSSRARAGADLPGSTVATAQGNLPGREFSDPFAEPPAAANLTATPPPKPTPLPAGATRPTEPMPNDRLSELLDQGKMLRDRGDTYAAVTKLREAVAMAEANNPLPTAELALTYEKMGFNEKATECWKAIYDMGEVAGVYFAAAEGKMKASQADALKVAGREDPVPAPNTKITSDWPAPAGRGDSVVGLNAHCKLGLLDITRQDEAGDSQTKRKFILKVPVKAKARARIDVHDVIVQVMFYDVVNGRALDRTNATVSYKWSNPPADWADDDVEVLEVTYVLPELRVTDEDRKFYGYLVSMYYKNALQDFRADPPSIAKQVPPPAALAQDPQ